MDIQDAHLLWDRFAEEHSRLRHRIRAARDAADLSMFAEYLAGAYLLSEGHRILKAEYWGDRIMSSRRRDKAKTCDFEALANGTQATLFVEVKHVVASSVDCPDYSSFIRSAHLKGARCLVVVRFTHDVESASRILVEDIEASRWEAWISRKNILKYRRNGLVSFVVLTLS